jgi:hypothetical protein
MTVILGPPALRRTISPICMLTSFDILGSGLHR